MSLYVDYEEPSTVKTMGKMNIVLTDKLEEDFRRAIADTKGLRKGNISEAIEEAIKEWIEKVERERTSRARRG
jgi:Arc/MetJ-type ribon-helix-helix transcriptional regulator